MVGGISHVNIPLAVHRHAFGAVKTCIAASAVQAAEMSSQTANRSNCASRCDLSYCVVHRVRNINVAVRVYGYTKREVKSCSIADIIRVARDTRLAGECCYCGIGSDFADREISIIGNVEVSIAVKGYALWKTKSGGQPCSIIGSRVAESAGERRH